MLVYNSYTMGWIIWGSKCSRGEFFSPSNCPDQLQGPPSPPSGSFAGPSSQDMKLTITIHQVLKLRMNGAIPQLLLCVFMLWTGTTLSLSIKLNM